MARTGVTGPAKGSYGAFQFIFPAVANNDTLIQRVSLPAAFRVQEVSAVADTVTSDPTYAVSNGAAGGTDVVAARNCAASDTVDTVAAASLTNRNLAKADVLTCTVVADLGDAATHLVVTVSGYFTDHMVSNGPTPNAND